MIQNKNNNLSVLPFYEKRDMQYSRRSYSYGEVYPLYCLNNFLPPFQIIREHSITYIPEINLYDKNGKHIKDITSEVERTGLQLVEFEQFGYDVIVYPGNVVMDLKISEGMYYITFNTGDDIIYSEVFTVVNSVEGYLKLEWYDDENVIFDNGQIVYKNPLFRNILYLCAELGKPDYEFEEEGEDRNGFFFPEKQISEKTYKFVILAPEYLCDVMRLIRMADHIQITDKYGEVYNCDSFLITPQWQTQGNLASVTVEFQTNTVVKKIGRGYLMPNSGDFNNDFNNDFNIY